MLPILWIRYLRLRRGKICSTKSHRWKGQCLDLESDPVPWRLLPPCLPLKLRAPHPGVTGHGALPWQV